MIDRNKIGGYFPKYRLDSTCDHRLHLYSRNGKTYEYFEIPNRKGDRFLTLSRPLENPNNIWIEGNTRKWWLPTGHACADLNCNQLYDAMCFLAKRINCDVYDLLELNFRSYELGFNLVLPKYTETIISSMIGYPQLKMEPHGEWTKYFKASYYHIIVYDKLTEIAENKKIPSKVRKAAKRLREHIFIMRFEISVDSPSKHWLFPKMKNMGDLILNFNDIADELHNSFMKIRLINRNTPLIEIPSRSLSRKDFIEYLVSDHINNIGLEQILMDSERLVKNHRPKSRTELERIYDKFRFDQNSNIKGEVSNILAKKIFQLKKYT